MEKYFSINKNGFSVRCKLYCRDIRQIDKVVIYGHGFCGHKENKAAGKIALRIQKRHPRVALLVFDWPCHGEDARSKLTLADCMTYLGVVIGYAKERFRTGELYACANSFGGYMFLKYIYENGDPFRRSVFRCPAVNMYDTLTASIISDDEMSLISKGKPVSVGFDRKVKVTADFLDEVRAADISDLDFRPFAADMLIIHGTKDEIVPFGFVRDFAEKNGIAFIAAEAADHRFTDPDIMDAAVDDMIGFYEF